MGGPHETLPYLSGAPSGKIGDMSRLLALWLTLLAAFWLTRAASSALLFGVVDRGYGEAFQLVAVPALQALLVAWATRRPGPFLHALPVRIALRQADLRGILLLDAAVLAAGLIFANHPWAGPWLGLAQGRNLPNAWIAIKAGAAGMVLGRSSRALSSKDDRWLLALAAGFLVLAALVLFGLLGPVPERFLSSQPRMLRWLAVHGSLFAAGTGLVLEVQRRFRRSHPAAVLALDWALGLALLAGLIAVVQLVRHPALPEPWASLAATLSSLSVTALLATALLDETGGVER
jgi:hypothetical protein